MLSLRVNQICAYDNGMVQHHHQGHVIASDNDELVVINHFN